jgi:hypothetical protein
VPSGKYTFYLHNDDRTDLLVAATFDGISQPLRGDFLRTAAIAGGVLYRTDTRLPALITELFSGKMHAAQIIFLTAALAGGRPAVSSTGDARWPLCRWQEEEHPEHYERRRMTLQLPAEDITVTLLETVPSRLRGQVIRQFITTGCALHTVDQRLPRLLANLPVPPESPEALVALLEEMAGQPETQTPACPSQEGSAHVPVNKQDSTTASSDRLRQNMKKIF